MGKDDWYRSAEWNAEIELAFRAKLSRSRTQRPQYLQIQASELAHLYPAIALKLIDEYFETQDEFFVPCALCTRAEAYCALGRVDDAVATYKKALEWELTHYGLATNARIDLPKLIAENNLSGEYDYALDILTSRFKASDHSFPLTRYDWNGSCALIAFDRGDVAVAKKFAERALRAAAEIESPFRYHRSVGVVRDTSDEFGQRIKRIARHSRLRSIFRSISNA